MHSIWYLDTDKCEFETPMDEYASEPPTTTPCLFLKSVFQEVFFESTGTTPNKLIHPSFDGSTSLHAYLEYFHLNLWYFIWKHPT